MERSILNRWVIVDLADDPGGWGGLMCRAFGSDPLLRPEVYHFPAEWHAAQDLPAFAGNHLVQWSDGEFTVVDPEFDQEPAEKKTCARCRYFTPHREFPQTRNGGCTNALCSMSLVPSNWSDCSFFSLDAPMTATRASMIEHNRDDAEADELNDIRNVRFKYHRPGDAQVGHIQCLRDNAKAFATAVHNLCPPSRERSLAITKLEEAIMWANAAIVRRED